MTGKGRHVGGVLDTNTLILLQQLEDPAMLPEEPVITAVALAELHRWSADRLEQP